MANFKKTDKDPFNGLDNDFKDLVDGMGPDEIKRKIAEVSINQMELMKAKREDKDLATQKELYNEAGAIYKEGTKRNRSCLEYCKMLLDNKGVK